MKRILIATDFSPHSRHTLKQVLNLVKDIQVPCKILLVNTYTVNESNPKLVISTNDRLKIESKAGLEAERSEALKLISNPNITIETSSHMGSLSNVLLKIIEQFNIDLIALGKDDGKKIKNISDQLKGKNCEVLVTDHSLIESSPSLL